MIELRTLGTLELRGTDGQEFRRIIQQPKRLALLAYLAAATPRRFHRRDALLALFWPDLDTEHARGSLRRSLYFLRRILGDDVIVGRGDEEVGLAPDALWCDTVAFDEGLKEDAPAALDLYRGDFLQGFYISGAPEFERWLDRERARLLELAATTAWRVADDAIASHPTAAARRARWAAALTPYDDEAHRRLIALLVRVGDRAGAMRVHDDFVRRLRADYEVAPSSEMQALVQSLTTTSTPPVAAAIPAEPARRPPASPNVVAVLPFTVRGSRELAYLSEGMVDLLSTTLDGAGDLRAVDARALLAHLAHGEDRPLDPERGRAAARALGAGRYVLGGIVLAGARIRITATLYDHSAAPTRTAEVTGNTEAGIFDMVDDLGRQLLGGEGSGPGARMANLAARTTESLSALKAYLRGEADFRAGRYFQALESFQNAAAEDTGFALAWYRLAAAAAATADLALAREASAQASQNRDRLGAHDRILLDAQRAWLRGAADEAERLYAAALATHVDDIEAWFALGDVL
ncbi:MAG: transcriptional activator protein, partial [Gemmatimonadetes bacterium]|nr:transcriptional activator protein [Gemmatimonadota bacterium]